MCKDILGIKIDKLTKYDVQKKIIEFLISDEQHIVFTPNPEMIVKAQKDDYFKQVLNSSSLNICDGVGIAMLTPGIQRFAGVDFIDSICEIAEKRGESVFLLGTGDINVLKQAALELGRRYPSLQIADLHEGPRVVEDEDSLIELESGVNELVKERINRSHATILFVAFGHGKQEKWILKHLNDLNEIKLAIGVGGALDYLGSKVTRAPVIIRNLGLEWLWRVIKQPKRIKRTKNAVIVFPYLYLLDSLKKIFKIYGKN